MLFAKDNNAFFEFHADMCVAKSQEVHKVLLQWNVLYSFEGINLVP